jgi:hypothetical protein
MATGWTAATISPTPLNDPTLASRHFIDPMTGYRDVGATASTFQNPNVPAYLTQAVANLNATQQMRSSAQQDLTQRLFQGVQSGGPDAYLWAEALRSASATPGAHVNFGSAVQNPLVGQGYFNAAGAFQQRAKEQSDAIRAASTAQSKLALLQQQRSMLGATPFGTYDQSPQKKLDDQIFNAMTAVQPQSAVQQLGVASARGNSGWMPTLPSY